MKNKLLIMLILMLLCVGGTVFGIYCPECEEERGVSYKYAAGAKHVVLMECGHTVDEDHYDFIYCSPIDENYHSCTCSQCGQGTLSRKHTFSSYTYNAGTGTHSKSCTLCGYTVTEDCSRGAWYEYSPEQHARKCSVCKYEGKLNHVFDSNPCPTCGGYQTCSTCGATYHTCVNPCDHNFERTYITTYETHTPVDTCSLCGLEARGDSELHKYGEWQEGAKATCTSPGTKIRVCSVCSRTESQETDPLGHNYPDTWEYNALQHYKVCTNCGNKDSIAEHQLTSKEIRAATCLENGQAEYSCTVCTYTYTEDTAKSEHSWGSYMPNGSTGHRRKCSECGTFSATERHVYMDGWVQTLTAPTHSHCHRCSICAYEADIKVHNMVVTWKGLINGVQHHKFKCSDCNYESVEERCTYKEEMTQTPTCTREGIRKYTCTICEQYYTEPIEMLEHIWSDWDVTQTQHWKNCTYGCGEKILIGNHRDVSVVDGYCDDCNYLMYIVPEATISSDVAVKEGEKATFLVNVQKGTEPLSYKWYYKTSQTGTANLIAGETTSTLSIVTTKEMNDRLYYCVVSNPGGEHTTNTAKLTVYYPFTLEVISPAELILKKDETGTFTVEVSVEGNPDTYTYQWYVANSSTTAGSKIEGATEFSYSIKPTQNVDAQYYYCVVSNREYDIQSTRAKLSADIVLPEVLMGTFNSGLIINKTNTLKVPFVVTDTGLGYTEDNSNFTANDIKVLVGGTEDVNVTKTLKYIGSSGNNYNYELTLSNITLEGKLSFESVNGAVKDDVGNISVSKTFSTNVVVDNTPPVITFEEITGDINENYANVEDTLKIKLVVTEVVGFSIDEFTIEDIIIKVGGSDITNSVTKVLEYKNNIGNKYEYELVLEGLTGDGELILEVLQDKVKDKAGNKNGATELRLKVNNEYVIIDNTKPVINSLKTTLGGYTSSRVYPDAIEARHNGWANENIFVTIDATDNNKIDYYMKSIGDTNSYEKIGSNQEELKESVDNNVYYRVFDKAGNYADINKYIKLDKITPNAPKISLFEQRQNGAEYNYAIQGAIAESIYVIPDASTVVDSGIVQSGIEKAQQYTYYVIDSYVDLDKTATLEASRIYSWNQGVLLEQKGYYEIKMVMTDIAGNQVATEVYKVYIDKKAENTIRISNINDIGSGINKITIDIYKSNSAGVKTNVKAVDSIVVNNPYKEIIKNVKLGAGKFFVEITLEDGVGNTSVLKGDKYIIINNL